MEDRTQSEGDPVKGSPHVFLPDGSDVHNPGIDFEWHGEHGKGFSVVAAEIRELSERTASSTRDITLLIRAVQEEVENALKAMSSGSQLVETGVSLSHQAGRALNNILDSTAKASTMGKEIAGATREQAAGSEAVTLAVGYAAGEHRRMRTDRRPCDPC